MKDDPELTRQQRRSQKKRKYHRYNLIPQRETVGLAAGLKYADQMLCMELAEGRTEEYERLWSRVPAVEVHEMEGLQRAYHF